jgi:hypothetical protein
MEIIKALSAVMDEVGGVSKKERNNAQGFNFRGIDAVVNAVSPALRKNNVVVVPELINAEYETVTVGAKQTLMGHARVTVKYAFYAQDGSNIAATVAAESMDSGDKATAKAMSVAFRTALLQALCLPTDETDPDANSYERSDKPAIPLVRPAAPRTSTNPPAQPKTLRNPVLSAAQIVWVTEQITKAFAGEPILVVVSDLIGRTITDFSEVTTEEKKILVAKLSGGK